MAERIRGYGGEEQSSVDLFNMSDRRERTWDRCRGLLLHFGEFFPLTQKLASLNPKRFHAGRVSAEIKYLLVHLLPGL